VHAHDLALRTSRHWIPTGLIGQVHVNDRNRRSPGQGEGEFAGFPHALAETGYTGAVGVEPFDYHPDPPSCATRAIGYLRGIEEASVP
jgi:D-psicose/D-tagatose/L-ribulose 3-epimerase